MVNTEELKKNSCKHKGTKQTTIVNTKELKNNCKHKETKKITVNTKELNKQ